VLTAATTFLGETTIKGKVSSKPNTTFKIQFFSNPPAEDEGKVHRAEERHHQRQRGNAAFTFAPDQKVAVGQTVTATDGGGNTSEF
jgi:hypothetical protein